MSGEADIAGLSSPTADNQSEGRKNGSVWSWLKGLTRSRKADVTLRDTFEELIEEHEEDKESIDSGERTLIKNILNIRDLSAEDVMVPRADIGAVDIKSGLDDVIEIINAESHSRLPVYRQTLDDVLGMVHIKDILAETNKSEKFSLRKILRKVLFVAPTMPVMDLLLQMQLSRIHMALVVDEYGGIDGLITIEDLVEQIVGEIDDEHDEVAVPQIERLSERTVVANARVSIDDFEAEVGPVLTDEEREDDIDTLGGLVSTVAGRVPTRGELIVHEATGIEFEVMDADPRRIKRIRARKLPKRNIILDE